MKMPGYIPIVIAVLVVLCVVYYIYLFGYGPEQFESGKGTVVLFYLPTCPPCQRLLPTWNKFEKKNVPGVIKKKVDSIKHPDKAEKNNVTSFPTIILFKNGKKYEYSGDRTVKSLEKFVSK